MEHGDEQSLGGMGAEDLPVESRIDKVRHPADVIDMGVGKEEVIDVGRGYGPSIKRRHPIVAHGQAAIDEDGGAGGDSKEVAGAGDRIASAEVC